MGTIHQSRQCSSIKRPSFAGPSVFRLTSCKVGGMTTVRLDGSLWNPNMVSALAASGVLVWKIEGMVG
jgi:outer membrane protein assembly factor BamB